MNRHVSPEAKTRWLRSKPRPGDLPCICCDGPHVYGYALDLPDGTRLDFDHFVWSIIRKLPEGTRFRVVIESGPDEG